MMMRIGELAERSGVSTKALRYYEEIGLLQPAERSASGYRLFGEDAMRRLAFVRAARGFGLTLGEIREVIALRDDGEVPCAHVLALIGRRGDELEARIAEMQALRGELARLARRAQHLDSRDCDPVGICHLIQTAPSPPAGPRNAQAAPRRAGAPSRRHSV